MTKKLHFSTNPKYHHCDQNILALGPILSHLNQVYIKIFNILPSSLKSHMNKKAQFSGALKWYLNTYSFYSVDEFLMFENDSLYLSVCFVFL
jgi:hypothetical protein